MTLTCVLGHFPSTTSSTVLRWAVCDYPQSTTSTLHITPSTINCSFHVLYLYLNCCVCIYSPAICRLLILTKTTCLLKNVGLDLTSETEVWFLTLDLLCRMRADSSLLDSPITPAWSLASHHSTSLFTSFPLVPSWSAASAEATHRRKLETPKNQTKITFHTDFGPTSQHCV